VDAGLNSGPVVTSLAGDNNFFEKMTHLARQFQLVEVQALPQGEAKALSEQRKLRMYNKESCGAYQVIAI
jgi:hypothetical protein